MEHKHEKRSVGGDRQPKSGNHKPHRTPGDASKNYCSHMEWAGSKEHKSHSHRYAK